MYFSFLFPYEPEEKKQKKEPQRFAFFDDRELDELVEGAQANDQICNKIRSKHFSSKCLHFSATIKFPLRHYLLEKKYRSKQTKLYATNCIS